MMSSRTQCFGTPFSIALLATVSCGEPTSTAMDSAATASSDAETVEAPSEVEPETSTPSATGDGADEPSDSSEPSSSPNADAGQPSATQEDPPAETSEPDASPEPNDNPEPLPPDLGEGCVSSTAFPSSFARNCAGCHSTSGAQMGKAPDLFAFDGTPEQFLEQVRNGGMTMPAFSESALSETELTEIFDFFAAGAGADGASTNTESCNGEPLIGDQCSGVTEAVLPLYTEVPVDTEAMLTRNADGSLTLRAGGRVRGRHEREGDFSLFHAQYFENRSYTFIIEDTTPAGGNTIKVTWLPIADAAAEPAINFRYWYTGDGNVFHTNVSMDRVDARHWEHTAERNAREDREIQVGDRFDFEFGVFYDPDQVEGRTSYYSDTFRYVAGSGKLTPLEAADDAALSGGDTTIPFIYVEPELYFEQMALNIQGDNAQAFLEGRRLFHTDFVTGEHSEDGNPTFEAQASKAGPLANTTSCVSCHTHNGRGAPPASGGDAETLVFKTFAMDSSSAEPLEHPTYGRQLQTSTIEGFDAEGQVRVDNSDKVFTFPDGEEVVLSEPSYTWSGEAALFSPRLPRPVIGLGLLEAVAEETLLSFADAEDCNGDGVSGRPNLVPDPVSGVLRVGRFGWKAGKVSVRHQVADALQLDLGVTTSVLPIEDCGPGACDASSTPELSDEDLGLLENYMRLIGVPPQRDAGDESVQRGQATFQQVGCARCHQPSMTTSALHPLFELREQTIHAYTDLLLHDLGPDLADNGAGEHTAEASEWRTPPLWGLGLAATVSGEAHLLHDGRARSPLEAILWHGGEAEGARNAFAALDAEARAELLAFLESL